MTDKKFQCKFCNKEYVFEKRFINHLCDKKVRWLERDEKHVQIAFDNWKRWLQMTGSNKPLDNRNFESFMNSQLYKSFVKLGSFIKDVKIINPEMYLPYLIKNNININDWCKDSIYEKYVRNILTKEDVYTALNRIAVIMEKWSYETQLEWNEFFNFVDTNIALNHIRTGRISPWILMLSPSSQNMLTKRMSDEQFMLVNKYVDIPKWNIKIDREYENKSIVLEAITEWKI